MKGDIEVNNYYNVGSDAADVLILSLGKVPEKFKSTEAISDAEVNRFLGGIIARLVSKNDTSSIKFDELITSQIGDEIPKLFDLL